MWRDRGHWLATLTDREDDDRRAEAKSPAVVNAAW